eukprot:TRINITY_DN15989_c0_g2_i2.p1 TRINITY_DN15989_c0_g2~~TRINITY_DN15989_c0_g2_i2.p1  ORF type:complete len:515 (-),score=158.07 TRINITY_DN15989_c0_g2_i2:140-1684(-)
MRSEVPTNPFLEILKIPHPLQMATNVVQAPLPARSKSSASESIPIVSLSTSNKLQSFLVKRIVTHNFDRIESTLQLMVERIEEEIPTDSEASEKTYDEAAAEYGKASEDSQLSNARKRVQESVDMLERESPIKRIEREERARVVYESTEFRKGHQEQLMTRKTQDETSKRTQHQKKRREDHEAANNDTRRNGKSQIETALYEEIRKAIPREVVSTPIGSGVEAPEYFQGSRQMISEQFLTEEMPSTALNAKLEESLISCLIPLQLSRPRREFLSVETMYMQRFTRSTSIGEEQRPEEDDVERYIKESLARENMEQDEKKTAALMVKLIGFRTEEVLEKANKVQDELQQFGREIGQAEEELAKSERKAVYEELKMKLRMVESEFKEVPLDESIGEDNQTDDIQKTIKDNNALIHEANAWIELDSAEPIANTQLNKSLGKSSKVAETSMQGKKAKINNNKKPIQKRVTFAEGVKGDTKKKTKDELRELMSKVKLNKAVGEAFDQMGHMIEKYKVKK